MQLRIDDGLSAAKVEIFDDALLFGAPRVLAEARAAPEAFERAFPFGAGAGIAGRQRGEPLRRLDDAGEEIRALDIARKPVEMISCAGEHACF